MLRQRTRIASEFSRKEREPRRASDIDFYLVKGKMDGFFCKASFDEKNDITYDIANDISNDISEVETNDIQTTETLEERCGDKWISVKDRLPKDMERVLAYYDKHGEVDTTTYLKYSGSFSLEGNTYGKVTHWMPLPKAPENIPDDAAIKEELKEIKETVKKSNTLPNVLLLTSLTGMIGLILISVINLIR